MGLGGRYIELRPPSRRNVLHHSMGFHPEVRNGVLSVICIKYNAFKFLLAARARLVAPKATSPHVPTKIKKRTIKSGIMAWAP